MIATITINKINYIIDLSKPLDLSIPIKNGEENPNCFWAPYPIFEPYKAGSFIGATYTGAPVNFYNVKINPHGNGTHTECVGHIATETYAIRNCLQQHWFKARLISIQPTKIEKGDTVIMRESIRPLLENMEDCTALIIRTLPNQVHKRTKLYSGNNPTYLDVQAMQLIVEKGIEHFLIDLPSVDREEDKGALLSHHAFWNYPPYGTKATAEDLEKVRQHCTISELLYIDDSIADGDYFLNLQTVSFDLDVSPSKPVLYKLLGV